MICGFGEIQYIVSLHILNQIGVCIVTIYNDVMREDDHWLTAIDKLIKGYLSLAESYHNYHQSGFTDFKNSFQLSDVGQNRLEEIIVANVNDTRLLKILTSSKEQLDAIKILDNKITRWLADYLGVKSTQDRNNNDLMIRRMKKIVVKEGPSWVLQPKYKTFVNESNSIIEKMWGFAELANRRIIELRSQS
jgi:hypothetical protein